MLLTKVSSLAFLNNGGEMGELMRTKDWSETALGTPDTWPQSLRISVSILLNSQFPMFVWWGDTHITLYNDAYRVILGNKHPQALGESGPKVWAEIWDVVGPLAHRVLKNGESNWAEDQILYINRSGFVEESYFTFSYSPVLDESGKIGGVFCACTETTEKVLAAQKVQESERNLRNTILQSPVAMCILKGPSFVVEIANTRMFELWGRGAGEMLQTPIFEGLPEVRHQGLEELLLRVYNKGETITASERPIQLPRNNLVETVYVNFVYEPFREGDGTVSGVLVVASEVTDQVVARRKIEESEARTRLAVATARLGTYDIDLVHQTIIYTPRLAEIFGLDTNRHWPYKAFTDAVHPDDKPIREKAHEEAAQTGELLYEVRIITPDSSLRWIRLNGKSMFDEARPLSLVGTVMDITEEKKAAEFLEQKIEERTRELRQVNEQLKQFTYAASHDLQEPLRKISFFLDRLLLNVAPYLNDDNKRISERIIHTTGRMRSLIDDLLAYSNTSMGVTSADEVDLAEIVKDVLDDMEATIIENGATVELKDLPRVKGDLRQLRQLFQNLIGNALKYHKKGNAPQVQIHSQIVNGNDFEAIVALERRKERFYAINVKDNGIGFDQGDAERIFRLFQRLHGKAEYEGTGVGLAIVQKVVENHKGYIWAESTSGNGATFHILLPIDFTATETAL